jgi:RNA polymerase sigma-70 factor (TIGR02943 family)
MAHTPSNPEQWVDLYADALFSFALKFITQPDQAQNLVQETFLAALKNRSGFKGNSSEKTWLLGILKHKITDHLRLKYKEVPASQLVEENMHIEQFFDNARDGHLAKEPGHWEFNPAALIENKEFWLAFNACISKLPEKTAQAFSLRELDDLDSREICKVLGISSTNLWVLLHRARLQLRQCLELNWFEKNVK